MNFETLSLLLVFVLDSVISYGHAFTSSSTSSSSSSSTTMRSNITKKLTVMRNLLPDYMLKTIAEVKAAIDGEEQQEIQKDDEIQELKRQVNELLQNTASGAANHDEDCKNNTYSADASIINTCSEMTKEQMEVDLFMFQEFMSNFIVEAHQDKLTAIQEAENSVKKEYEERICLRLLEDTCNDVPAATFVSSSLENLNNHKSERAPLSSLSERTNLGVDIVLNSEATTPSPPQDVASSSDLSEVINLGAIFTHTAATPLPAASEIVNHKKTGREKRPSSLSKRISLGYKFALHSGNKDQILASETFRETRSVNRNAQNEGLNDAALSPSLVERINLGTQIVNANDVDGTVVKKDSLIEASSFSPSSASQGANDPSKLAPTATDRRQEDNSFDLENENQADDGSPPNENGVIAPELAEPIGLGTYFHEKTSTSLPPPLGFSIVSESSTKSPMSLPQDQQQRDPPYFVTENGSVDNPNIETNLSLVESISLGTKIISNLDSVEEPGPESEKAIKDARLVADHEVTQEAERLKAEERLEPQRIAEGKAEEYAHLEAQLKEEEKSKEAARLKAEEDTRLEAQHVEVENVKEAARLWAIKQDRIGAEKELRFKILKSKLIAEQNIKESTTKTPLRIAPNSFGGRNSRSLVDASSSAPRFQRTPTLKSNRIQQPVSVVNTIGSRSKLLDDAPARPSLKTQVKQQFPSRRNTFTVTQEKSKCKKSSHSKDLGDFTSTPKGQDGLIDNENTKRPEASKSQQFGSSVLRRMRATKQNEMDRGPTEAIKTIRKSMMRSSEPLAWISLPANQLDSVPTAAVDLRPRIESMSKPFAGRNTSALKIRNRSTVLNASPNTPDFIFSQTCSSESKVITTSVCDHDHKTNGIGSNKTADPLNLGSQKLAPNPMCAGRFLHI